MLANAFGTTHSASEKDALRRQSRLDQNLYIFANSIVEAGKDPFSLLSLVCQVCHVGLQDDGATSGEGGRVRNRGTKIARFFHGKVKPFHHWRRKLPVP